MGISAIFKDVLHNKVHGDNMGPTWALSAQTGPMLARFLVIMATNRNGQNLNRHKPKRPQTGLATNWNGHKLEWPQTETVTNRNGDKPKRPQTRTATNRNGHKPSDSASHIRILLELSTCISYEHQFMGYIIYICIKRRLCSCGFLRWVSYGLNPLRPSDAYVGRQSKHH